MQFESSAGVFYALEWFGTDKEIAVEWRPKQAVWNQPEMMFILDFERFIYLFWYMWTYILTC